MRARRIFAVILVVFAAVLAPLTITAYWIHDRIMSTDGYVETVAPLADNQDVTDAIATRVVDTLFERADVQKRITDVLPGPVDALGRTFSNSLRNLATNQTESFLESDTFKKLWIDANRIAHEQVVAMFTGKGDAVSANDNEVVLDLGVVADKVRERLVDRGVGILNRVKIPDDAVTVTLFQSDEIPRLKTLFRVLDDAATVLPILLLASIAGAIALSVRRRRTVIELGFGIAAASAILLAAIHILERQYQSAVGNTELNPDAAKAVFDTLVSALEDWAWLAMVLALVVAGAAFVTDPGRIQWFTHKLHGDTAANRVGLAPWVRAQRTPLRVGAAALALVTLVVWPNPTLLVVVVMLVLLALVLGMITALVRIAKPAVESVSEEITDSPAEAPADSDH